MNTEKKNPVIKYYYKISFTLHKMKPTFKNTLLAIGMFMNSASIIATHYIVLSDFSSGLLLGSGIGIMLLAIINMKREVI
jgi:hypothetical protein